MRINPMRASSIILAFLGTLVLANPALSACPVTDAKVENAIATKPKLHDKANAQLVRDLRTLRDAPSCLTPTSMMVPASRSLLF